MAFYPTKETTKNIRTFRAASEILDLVAAIERGTLPPAEWHAATFLTLAFWHLYLNDLPDAVRLLRESVARYEFENRLAGGGFGWIEKAEIPLLLAAMADFIKIYKGAKSFVALANLVRRHFADHRRPLRNYRRAHLFFPNAVLEPLNREGSR